MKNMNIGYVRVSKVKQNEDKQIKALENNNIDHWYIEKVNIKDTNRPQLCKMLEIGRASCRERV